MIPPRAGGKGPPSPKARVVLRSPEGAGHTTRIIPRLDIKGPNVVKGSNSRPARRRRPRRPACAIMRKEPTSSSTWTSWRPYGRSLLPIVERTARRFVPLTVGGA